MKRKTLISYIEWKKEEKNRKAKMDTTSKNKSFSRQRYRSNLIQNYSTLLLCAISDGKIEKRYRDDIKSISSGQYRLYAYNIFYHRFSEVIPKIASEIETKRYVGVM